jgi:hypothetical protein
MNDEDMLQEENKSGNRRIMLIVGAAVILACCCVSFLAAGWFLGDNVMEFLCEQVGVGCF